MCKHKNILVAHYVNEETCNYIGCRIRCVDCDVLLYSSKDKGYKIAYDYIECNKDEFDTLIDYTCDNLNLKFGIEDGFKRLMNNDF